MSRTDAAHRVAPVSATERLDAIEIVRGIALYGVMAINVVTAFRISIFQQFLPQVAQAGAMNRFVDRFLAAVFGNNLMGAPGLAASAHCQAAGQMNRTGSSSIAACRRQ